MTWEPTPAEALRRVTPHTVRVTWSVLERGPEPPGKTGFSVLTHAWIWTGGSNGRRIPDVRLTERGEIPGQHSPGSRAELAAQLRLIADRLDRPA